MAHYYGDGTEDYQVFPRMMWFGQEKTRYEFHHASEWPANASENMNGTRISLVDERTTERVTYRLPAALYRSNRFPLRELMYTFAEQIGVRLEQLEFRYKGALLALDATPESLGMTAETDYVVVVSSTRSPHEKRVESLAALNRMGKVPVQAGPHQGAAFGSHLLPLILEYSGLEALVNASQVCRHWFHVSQRFAVLVQLQDGDSGTWQQGQNYPLLLHNGCRHSFNLAVCQAMETGKQTRWDTALLQKDRIENQAFGYCKAAGCTVVKSVYMSSITRDLESKWEALENAKTAFMSHVKLAHKPPSEIMGKAEFSNGSLQEFPPNDDAGDGFIAEARDWRYKNCAVELYRRYFGPDMHYIFPLIVNKQSAVGLDFGSCTTSLIFGASSDAAHSDETRTGRIRRVIGRRRNNRATYTPPRIGGGLPSPLGSVSWRIHDAGDIAAKGMGCTSNKITNESNPSLQMINGSKPQIVLEVLFIAVWETDRGGKYGSALVAALESIASAYVKSKGQNSALLYVEIGFEQPKAKNFWGNNGMLPVVYKGKKNT